MKTMLRRLVQPAFTLIELVITIVVIGILSAALVATYSDVSGSAKKAAQQASLSALQSQIAIHLAAYPIHKFPTMYDLVQEVHNLYVGYSSSTAGMPAVTSPNLFATTGSFNVYLSAVSTMNNPNPPAAAPTPSSFFFFVPTPAGAVVLLAFSDPFCMTPVTNPQTLDPRFSIVGFTQAAQAAPVVSSAPIDYSTFTSLPPFDAVVQCVRIPSFAEMNDASNKTLMDSLPVITRQ